MSLESTVAVITGASSGIGRATALRLAARGVHTVLVARDGARVTSVAEQIRSKGGQATTHPADVSDFGQLQELTEAVAREQGRLDLLVNSAGVMTVGSSLEIPVEDWRAMIDINVTGLILLTKLALPLMLESVGSSPRNVVDIINIASLAGRSSKAHHNVYNATKWAVIGFSEALRQEFARDGLRVSVLEPGLTATEIFEKQPPDARAYFRGITSDKAILDADDIAEVIEFTVTRKPHIGLSEIVIRPAQM